MGNPALAFQGSRVDSWGSPLLETSSLPALGHTLGLGGHKLSPPVSLGLLVGCGGPRHALEGLEAGGAAHPTQSKEQAQGAEALPQILCL